MAVVYKDNFTNANQKCIEILKYLMPTTREELKKDIIEIVKKVWPLVLKEIVTPEPIFDLPEDVQLDLLQTDADGYLILNQDDDLPLINFEKAPLSPKDSFVIEKILDACVDIIV